MSSYPSRAGSAAHLSRLWAGGDKRPRRARAFVGCDGWESVVVSGAHLARHPMGRTPTAPGLGKPGGREAGRAVVLHDPRSSSLARALAWSCGDGQVAGAGVPYDPAGRRRPSAQGRLAASRPSQRAVPLSLAPDARATHHDRECPWLATERRQRFRCNALRSGSGPSRRSFRSTGGRHYAVVPRAPSPAKTRRSRAGAIRPEPIECPPAKSDRFKRNSLNGMHRICKGSPPC